jgi:predicted acylesterase/phospholipase RssA
MEQEFADNTPDTPTSDMKSASTIQTLLRSYLVQSADRHEFGVQQADVVIEPDTTRFDLTAFTKTDELAKVGEEAALKALPGIKQLLSRLDGKLFKSPA